MNTKRSQQKSATTIAWKERANRRKCMASSHSCVHFDYDYFCDERCMKPLIIFQKEMIPIKLHKTHNQQTNQTTRNGDIDGKSYTYTTTHTHILTKQDGESLKSILHENRFRFYLRDP